MKIGVLGGSFNPPHNAHKQVAQDILDQGLVDEVWFCPSYDHPFGKKNTGFDTRVSWVRTMCKDMFRTRCTEIESILPSPSYTINTLDKLQEVYPGYSFHLIIGSDVQAELPRWRRGVEIQERHHILVIPRGGHSNVPDISSTRIREHLAQGKDVSQWVDPGIIDSIRGVFTQT